MNTATFGHWYISAFLIGFGLLSLVRPDKLVDPKCLFKGDLKDRELAPRLLAILERRQAIEAFPRAGNFSIAGISIALGIASAVGVILPVVAYAMLGLVIAITFGLAFLRMRNTNVRRAATLTPRSAGTTLNSIWYGCAVIASLLPSIYCTTPGLELASVLVTLSSMAIVIISIRTAGMASILTGDDSELEVIVDERLRRVRVATLLLFGYTVPFVFIAIGTPAGGSFWEVFAFAWCGAFFLAYGSWYAYTLLRPNAALSPAQWHPTL